MTELEYLESTFFNVLGDLKEYLDDLTLVGGWLSYVYAKYVWGNLAIKPVTTVDIDFGLSAGEMCVYPKTIFELLSSIMIFPKWEIIGQIKIYRKEWKLLGLVRIITTQLLRNCMRSFMGIQQ